MRENSEVTYQQVNAIYDALHEGGFDCKVALVGGESP